MSEGVGGKALVPTEDWMLVRPVEEERSVAVVSFDKGEVGQDTVFEVVSAGPGYYDHLGQFRECVYQAGDVVITEGLNARIFRFGGRKYYAVRGRDVAFKVEERKG